MYSILSIAFWAQQCKNSIRGVRNFSISTDWRQHGMKHHKYSGAPVSQAIRGDGSKWPPLLSDVSISGEVIYNIPPNPRIFRPCEADVSTTRGSFTTGGVIYYHLPWCGVTTQLSVGQDTSNAASGRVQALRAVVSRTSKPRWDTVSNTFLKSGEFQIFYHPP